MSASSRIRFGINISASAEPGRDPVADARFAEDLGFDLVSTSDHPGSPYPCFEAWTLLSWIAAATDRVLVLPRVLGVPFRVPALVAKAAESFDRLAGGRLVLGLGAGYDDDEFRRLGLPAQTPGEKVRGLDDALHILRGLWSQGNFTHDGSVYRTDAAHLEPKPQRSIPIWLGTFGDRALDLTGRWADGWIPSRGYRPDDDLAGMRQRVLDAAERQGRAPGDITCALNVQVVLDDHAPHDADRFTGSSARLIDSFAHFAELGFTTFSIGPPESDWRAQAERLAGEVLPAVRAAAS